MTQKEFRLLEKKLYHIFKSILTEEEFDLDKPEQIIGGKGDYKSNEEFDPIELAIGVLVEKEHTKDVFQALEIAKDHLSEVEDYYTRLIKSGLVDEDEALLIAKILKPSIFE